MPLIGQKFTYGKLGVVHLSVRANAVRVSARWRRGAVYLTVPRTMTADEVYEVLKKFEPQLMAMRPGTRHHDGERLEYHDFAITITAQSLTPGYIEIARAKAPNEYILYAGPQLNQDKAGLDAQIDKMVLTFAQSHAAPLMSRAAATAERLGCKVKEWRIGHGMNRLGACSSRGVITLSKRVVLLPVELQHYVVCHELAHLTHFDHSAAFHALLDRYLDGRERQLTASMRQWLRTHTV